MAIEPQCSSLSACAHWRKEVQEFAVQKGRLLELANPKRRQAQALKTLLPSGA